MFKAIKNFISDSWKSGHFLACKFTPIHLHFLTVPLFALTAGPVTRAYAGYLNYKFERDAKRKVEQHPDVGTFEQKLRDVFGETSINGYTFNDDEIAMRLNDAKFVIVFPDSGKNVSMPLRDDSSYEGLGLNREDAARNMIGKLASNLAADRSLNEYQERVEYYLKASTGHGASSHFYKAAHIYNRDEAAALDGFMVVSHPAAPPQKDDHTLYTIMEVDAKTDAYLRSLGL